MFDARSYLLTSLDGIGRKSRRRNNFGSYVWCNRHGERVDFMPGFDPNRPSFRFALL